MRELTGQHKGPLVLLHGGAGPQDPRSGGAGEAAKELAAIAQEAAARLATESGQELVRFCIKAMEDAERFNAGRGSALQADGLARQTAAFMAGGSQTFSGVIGATYVDNPIDLAIYGQGQASRVVAPPGTELLARQAGTPIRMNLTPRRLERFVERVQRSETQWDTVGCVLRCAKGELWAGTSTGGRGFEFPGRVSDSGTVAGNYASRYAAVSATGIGEEIVDDALAARFETRIRDGMALVATNQKCLSEAESAGRRYGWIAVDGNEGWALAHTTPNMPAVVWGPGGAVWVSSSS